MPVTGSPKVHSHPVTGPLPLGCDTSVNCTGVNAQFGESNMKLAYGGLYTVTVLVTVVLQLSDVMTIRLTLYVPPVV